MEYEVFFVREQKKILVQEGISLLEAQRLAGLQPDAPCGGQGKCGKCLADLVWEKGREEVKACQYRVTSNLRVETREKTRAHAILTEGFQRAIPLNPVIRAGFITFRKLRLGEALSQWERILEALKETFGDSMQDLQPDLKLCSSLYDRLGKTNTWFVVLGDQKILSMTEEKVPVYGAAVDIGTTSVVGYLLDMTTGKTLAAESRINPQAQYGADVIMRSDYAMQHGTEILSGCIRSCLAEILQALAEDQGIRTEDIYGVSAVGNTCMHHLLLNISPGSLSHAPYNPAIRQQLTIPGRDCGLPIHENGQLILLPNIAGFVGADTMGCLLSTRPDQSSEMTLMIDIGTNGEMVLGNKNRLLTCSTAAGPAFEGAKIECGMRGAAGAVDHVSYENGTFSYTTVGGGKAVGLCGSGLIDLTAALLQAGLIDESGYLDLPDGSSRFILVPETESGNGKPVYLSQKDVREVQLAKAAIAAGIILLCKNMKITLAKIDRVYIAGAFGNYMDADSACTIGLIPKELRQKIMPIGNAAGEGAKIAILNRKELLESQALSQHISFVELAASPEFQDCFVDQLEFGSEEDN